MNLMTHFSVVVWWRRSKTHAHPLAPGCLSPPCSCIHAPCWDISASSTCSRGQLMKLDVLCSRPLCRPKYKPQERTAQLRVIFNWSCKNKNSGKKDCLVESALPSTPPGLDLGSITAWLTTHGIPLCRLAQPLGFLCHFPP